ncbi:MAG TPA: helix-turn-helix transcriptional regulator [Trebonia sp.]|nr:helix-turn-helix transcriptional regulator [Trebonia sp.]
MTITPSSSAKEAKKALGARMREVRKEAGLTARALAQLTGQHYTRVSKIENGAQVPTDKDIRVWCSACEAEDQVPDLVATARAVESAYLEYRRQARAGVKRAVGPFTWERYAATTTFRIYEHNLIPSEFQTRAYCAAMLSFWIEFLAVPNDLQAAVEERMRRQEVISWRGKEFRVVLEEQALRTWIADPGVHAGQLGRLLEVMGNPAVAFGIVPLMRRRSGVPSTPFMIFDEDLVGLETPSATIEVTRPEEIALYVKLFDRLEQAAVYGAEARALIVKALDDMP